MNMKHLEAALEDVVAGWLPIHYGVCKLFCESLGMGA